jgi:ribonuclease HI
MSFADETQATMQASNPHYLLFSESTLERGDAPRWKFVLQSVGDEEHFSAADTERETRASRLELLAVVRGLEALGQPSRVTLLTRSRYVRRGIRRELNQWRERRWCWERFGNVVPIRDHDLWQRIDRALQYHQVECCAWTSDAAGGHAAERSVFGRSGRRSTRRHDRGWNVAAMLGGLRRSVLTPISSIWRPPFTRAA